MGPLRTDLASGRRRGHASPRRSSTRRPPTPSGQATPPCRRGCRTAATAAQRPAARRLRRKRAEGRARTDGRGGLHAIAIVVDPSAYATVNAEAYHRRTSIPALLGEVLTAAPPPLAGPGGNGPRWRRTGQGRRANQHTRIHLEDTAWHRLHIDAISARQTTGRWIGLRIEAWAAAVQHPAMTVEPGSVVALELTNTVLDQASVGHPANGHGSNRPT